MEHTVISRFLSVIRIFSLLTGTALIQSLPPTYALCDTSLRYLCFVSFFAISVLPLTCHVLLPFISQQLHFFHTRKRRAHPPPSRYTTKISPGVKLSPPRPLHVAQPLTMCVSYPYCSLLTPVRAHYYPIVFAAHSTSF